MFPDPHSPTEPHTPESAVTDDSLLAMGKGALHSSGSGKSTGWVPPTAEALQAQMPGYEIHKFLARGGMGAVYRGVQSSLGRVVAIKILPPDLMEGDEKYAERFKQEARAMGQLNHPGIVSVYDFGEMKDGTLFFVMEFIEGTDVAQMVAAQGRLSSQDAMAITAHVCDALQYAHEHGVVHRDIKPANIMVGYDGRVKVADFGLAKTSIAGETGLTRSGMVMGTLHFMAPEALVLGSEVDQRADIYAVGVMLYQMLTGKLPQGLFEMPSLQVRGLDPRYDGIISQALRESREQRYQQIHEMRLALDGILTQPVARLEVSDTPAPPPAALATQARPKRSPQQPFRPPQRQVVVSKPSHTGTILIWGSVVVLGGIVAWFALKKPDQSTAKTTNSAQAGEPRVTKPSSAPSVEFKKDNPFVNSLGMKFVSVPGTNLLFCIHETRRQDFLTFLKKTSGVADSGNTRANRGIEASDLDKLPAVASWNDATAFCAWLSREEGRRYQLPTSQEWGWAAGIGELQSITNPSSEQKAQMENHFPFGSQWPPPAGAGNYGQIEGLEDDGFPDVAPVMRFKPNPLGLYDMGGNLWEWCQDKHLTRPEERLMRGGCFNSNTREFLKSLSTNSNPADSRRVIYGFRCALVAEDALITTKATSETPSSPIAGGPSPAAATKDKPYVNTLGMKFVPVPGTDVLMCIHETRTDDYALYAGAVTGVDMSWKSPGFGRTVAPGDHHPVTVVGLDGAKEFCRWLGDKEKLIYRLPTDQEWSMAVGLSGKGGAEQNAGIYPWGRGWPPPEGAGNYNDESVPSEFARSGVEPPIAGYRDGFSSTAPVMSFKPNELGIYDLGGNVQEFVESGAKWHYRGASWKTCKREGLESSRWGLSPVSGRSSDVGFRCVLVLRESSAASTSGTATAGKPTATPESNPISVGPPPGTQPKTTDLLALVDLARDADLGQWSRTKEGLCVETKTDTRGAETRTMLPYAVATEDYDFEIEFSLLGDTPDSNFYQRFPAGGKTLAWNAQLFKAATKPYFGFPNVDGLSAPRAKDAYIRKAFLFKQGVHYTSLVRVRKGELSAAINGEELVAWKGDLKRFSLSLGRRFPNPQFLEVGFGEGGAIIHKASITEYVAASPQPPGTAQTISVETDLLTLFNPASDAVSGSWSKTQEGLSVEQSDRGPFVIATKFTPLQEFDFEIEFSSKSEKVSSINQLFEVNGKLLEWTMNAHPDWAKPYFGFPRLDGIDLVKSPEAGVALMPQFLPGKRYRSVVKVRHESITGLLDGKEIVRWNGDLGRFASATAYGIAAHKIALLSWGGGATFHSARITEFVPATPEAVQLEKQYLASVQKNAPTAPSLASIYREQLRPLNLRSRTLPQPWTDTKGRSILATFKAVKDADVLLDIRGKIQRVPLNGLSQEFRHLAISYDTPAGTSSVAAPAVVVVADSAADGRVKLLPPDPSVPKSNREKPATRKEAVKIASFEIKPNPATAGRQIKAVCTVRNLSGIDFRIPMAEAFGSYPLARWQFYVERLGKDSVIPSFQAGRVGKRYGQGGSLLELPDKQLSFYAGEGVEFQRTINTQGFPPGKYRCYVELHELDTKEVFASEQVDFELLP